MCLFFVDGALKDPETVDNIIIGALPHHRRPALTRHLQNVHVTRRGAISSLRRVHAPAGACGEPAKYGTSEHTGRSENENIRVRSHASEKPQIGKRDRPLSIKPALFRANQISVVPSRNEGIVRSY